MVRLTFEDLAGEPWVDPRLQRRQERDAQREAEQAERDRKNSLSLREKIYEAETIEEIKEILHEILDQIGDNCVRT